MSFEIGYHALALRDLTEDLIPYIRGERERWEGRERAVQALQNRMIANSWGLGILRMEVDWTTRQLKRMGEQQARQQGILGRLFRRQPHLDYTLIDTSKIDGAFDKDKHLFGRPFFIASDDLGEINRLVDQYLTVSMAESDALARSQVERLQPGLLERVTPDLKHEPEDLAMMTHQVQWKIEVMREAYLATVHGEAITSVAAEELGGREVLVSDLVISVVEAATHAQPSWMARGYVWVTLLLAEAGLELLHVTTLRDTFATFGDVDEEIITMIQPTIANNYSTGGLVMAAHVPEFRQYLLDHQQELLAKPTKEGWGDGCHLVLQKIDECLAYAEAHELAFLESSDIYSAPAGTIV